MMRAFQMDGFSIHAARSGGFVVMPALRPGDVIEIAFAGTIADCLEFLRAQLHAGSKEEVMGASASNAASKAFIHGGPAQYL